jgi:hypothetical protein
MTILTDEGERFMVESLFRNMDHSEFENVAYIDLDGSVEFPFPTQYLDMDGHVVCKQCRTLLDVPTWGDGADAYLCDNCGSEVAPDDTS